MREFMILWHWLPSVFRIREPQLLYAASLHGADLVKMRKMIDER